MISLAASAVRHQYARALVSNTCLLNGLVMLWCSGSIDGNNQLIIKGRFQQKQIESVLRRYISKLELNFCFYVEFKKSLKLFHFNVLL